MHIYLRTLGFSEFDTNMEEKLLRTAIRESIKNDYLIKHENFNRAAIVFKVSEHMGLYIYGIYENSKFKMSYYFPYLSGNTKDDNDEITIERHCDKESYAVICEELKAGVTLIFQLQNVMDYLYYLSSKDKFDYESFNLSKRNALSKESINGRKVTLSAMSVGGMILLPISKNDQQIKKYRDAADNRRKLIAAAKKGDESAIESLTIEDLDTYTQLSRRIEYEDVFSIVDSSFMPCGVECDQYAVIGEIMELNMEKNVYTGEEIYIMKLDCNDMNFDVAINKFDLIGEPAVGRRFKGQIWLQGEVKF